MQRKTREELETMTQVERNAYVDSLGKHNKSLLELIENPICDMNCPNGHPDCCNNICVQCKGAYSDLEFELRFTQVERNLINGLWDEQNGFLGAEGCKIPRPLRSRSCLEFICQGVKNA